MRVMIFGRSDAALFPSFLVFGGGGIDADVDDEDEDEDDTEDVGDMIDVGEAGCGAMIVGKGGMPEDADDAGTAGVSPRLLA